MKKIDVIEFSQKAEENLFGLISDFENNKYSHSKYSRFIICDPKKREIAKALVKDRIVHHAIHRILISIFEPGFIFDSYSSRTDKGIHKAILRLRTFILKITKNNTKTAWVLKCDIKKFFDSIDHEILSSLVRKKIKDEKLLILIEKIIQSYHKKPEKGIPLGNLTSQLFSNIYLNELDNFVKRELREKYYLRYADDFIILSSEKEQLEKLVLIIDNFLQTNLKLHLHPSKVSIRKIHQGVDFLGAVVFPTHIILRTKTKKRMLRKIRARKKELKAGIIDEKYFNQSLQSYLGMLTHCRGNGIKREISEIIEA
ncbi:MAG: reverse transcriptase/maturase family protein [bacterium]|nr:reverse transcriptase/maturase family protein [bacterium]